MRFRIHYHLPNGDEDSFDVEGDDLTALQEAAREGVEKRGGMDPWSMPLGEIPN